MDDIVVSAIVFYNEFNGIYLLIVFLNALGLGRAKI